MNIKMILALFGVMLFGAGIVLAISGATPTQIAQTRWNGSTPGNVTIEGGNISNTNINGTTLTDRWAAFFGNVSGTIILGDNDTTKVYTWSWAAANGGEVCLSTAGAYDFSKSNKTNALDVAVIDAAAFGLGVAVDNATNTFTSTNCDLVFNNVNASLTSSTANVTTTGGFNTCLLKNTATPTVTGDFAFCTKINNSGQDYKLGSSQYQIMVPTTPTVGATETYFFYMELN